MNRTRWAPPAVLLVAVVLGGFVPGARAAKSPTPSKLQVSAAASLTGAFTELGTVFEHQHAGVRVILNFAGSQQIATQIEQGSQADVFASADERWMSYLGDRGRVAGTSAIFARNRLVVIVPSTNPARIRRLQDLARGGVKLVIGADAVPVGHYARFLFANLSRDPSFGVDFATHTLRNVVSEEENVKSVVGKVQLGEADAGVVYRSDVTPNLARFIRMFELPEAANVFASYPIAVLNGSKLPEEGRSFVNLVLSEPGQKTLARWGLIPVAATSP